MFFELPDGSLINVLEIVSLSSFPCNNFAFRTKNGMEYCYDWRNKFIGDKEKQKVLEEDYKICYNNLKNVLLSIKL
jgi:hypothetical protein